MGKKQDEAAALLADLVKESGYVKCERCSTDNWEMFHMPGLICPKLEEEMTAAEDSAPRTCPECDGSGRICDICGALQDCACDLRKFIDCPTCSATGDV